MVVTLDGLDEAAMMQILTGPKNALVRQYKSLLQMDGAELEFTEDALRAVAKVAIGRKSGARGLRAILEKALMETMFNLPEHPEVVRVVVDKDVIENDAQPQMVVDETKRRLPQGQQVHARREAPKAIAEQSSVS